MAEDFCLLLDDDMIWLKLFFDEIFTIIVKKQIDKDYVIAVYLFPLSEAPPCWLKRQK